MVFFSHFLDDRFDNWWEDVDISWIKLLKYNVLSVLCVFFLCEFRFFTVQHVVLIVTAIPPNQLFMVRYVWGSSIQSKHWSNCLAIIGMLCVISFGVFANTVFFRNFSGLPQSVNAIPCLVLLGGALRFRRRFLVSVGFSLLATFASLAFFCFTLGLLGMLLEGVYIICALMWGRNYFVPTPVYTSFTPAHAHVRAA